MFDIVIGDDGDMNSIGCCGNNDGSNDIDDCSGLIGPGDGGGMSDIGDHMKDVIFDECTKGSMINVNGGMYDLDNDDDDSSMSDMGGCKNKDCFGGDDESSTINVVGGIEGSVVNIDVDGMNDDISGTTATGGDCNVTKDHGGNNNLCSQQNYFAETWRSRSVMHIIYPPATNTQ